MEPLRNPSQLYLIQIDPSFTSDLSNAQVVPLHLLENVLGTYSQVKEPQNKDNTQVPNSIVIKPDKVIENRNNAAAPTLFVDKSNNYKYDYTIQTDPVVDLPNLSSTLKYEIPETVKYKEPNTQELQTNSIEEYLNSFNTKYSANTLQNCTYEDNTVINDVYQKSNHNQISKANSKDISNSIIKKTKKTPKTIVPVSKQKPQNYIHISDTVMPPRAIAVLPSVLQIHNHIIWPKRTLSGRRRFGPVEGIFKKITTYESQQLMLLNLGSPLFLLKGKEDGFVTQIDVLDTDKSNWMGLLPLGEQSTANIWLYEEDNKLYGITTEPISARTPLQLGYSKKYVEDHELPQGVPSLDLESVLSSNPKQWWCNECHRVLPSAKMLQRHTDVYHKDFVVRYRRSLHRCIQCKRTFSRLFTLRRHIREHCLGKSDDKPSSTCSQEKPPEDMLPDISAALNNEDNRLPSDESFHNFSNGLDFSTNLFDTDRISTLDISSHSRPDEFNPYSLGNKDDNALNNETDSPEVAKKEESILESCKYCKEIIVKENKSKHLSNCPSKLLKCECGLSFTHKKRLAQHIHKKHPAEQPKNNIPEETEKKDNKNLYKCEYCPLSFKRRGMVCNHSWRVHGARLAAPVRRRERHFPCAACPKLYRSAAKRDAHTARHHPGVEKVKGHSIEVGERACAAAACGACPRQYATRAKLLQHMRAKHPHLPVAVKKPAKQKTNSMNISTPSANASHSGVTSKKVVNILSDKTLQEAWPKKKVDIIQYKSVPNQQHMNTNEEEFVYF